MNDRTSLQIEKNNNDSETNLILAKIVLKTIESGQINITDHLPLFNVFESIAKCAHAGSSMQSPIFSEKREDTIVSLVNNDSIGSFHDSSSLPSSVHVMDVTRDIRLAQEPTALPGVSLTGDVTNVIESELPSQGLSVGQQDTSQTISRKRSSRTGQLLSDTESGVPPFKRRGITEVPMEYGVINSLGALSDYAAKNTMLPNEIMADHQKLIATNPGKIGILNTVN
jgi:hypothetical protein